tara:strand:+ start:417 stop:791 length:375 start_codon:yes stop_codon:yes gene_type:complete
MKLTKSLLKTLIKEELEAVVSEGGSVWSDVPEEEEAEAATEEAEKASGPGAVYKGVATEAAESSLSDGKVTKLLQKLLDTLDNLDVSIDYLAGAVTGDDPLAIGVVQKDLGRLARRPPKPRGGE